MVRLPLFGASLRIHREESDKKERVITVFRLIGNNGFTTEDYPQPEIWAGVLQRAGLSQFEYFADHMEPLLFRDVIAERSGFFQATLKAIENHGLSVWSGATARVSYLLNMLSHPFEDMREGAQKWLKAFTDLSLALGAKHISGHYDCLSKPQMAEDLDGWIDRVCDELASFTEYAAEKGLKAVFLEQMHRPQLQPNTIERAHYMLERTNSKSAVPVHIHLDLGHMAHVREDPAHSERDKDPYEWLAEPFGDNQMLLIHAQQTDGKASWHWPFTPEYNEKGIIDALEVIRAVERSGVAEAVVALEVLFPRGTDIEKIEPAIAESAEYWRRAFGEAGYMEKEGAFVKTEEGN